MSDSSNVVQLFTNETDLDAAWQRFDQATRTLQTLYASNEPDESKRRAAANEAAAAELAYRQIYARLRPLASNS